MSSLIPVYFFGASNHGQGFGMNEDVFSPIELPVQNLESIASGGAHTLVLIKRTGGLTESATGYSLWVSGQNAVGQLGISNDTVFDLFDFVQQDTLDQVISVSAGWAHSLAIVCVPTTATMPTTKHGLGGLQPPNQLVYAWGGCRYNQLGLGDSFNRSYVYRPQIVTGLSSIRIAKVACGLYHSAAISFNGHCYTWGNNRHLQCGQSLTEITQSTFRRRRHHHPLSISSPYLLKLDAHLHVVDIALGANHTVLCTKEFHVITLGSNAYGQCGVDPQVTILKGEDDTHDRSDLESRSSHNLLSPRSIHFRCQSLHSSSSPSLISNLNHPLDLDNMELKPRPFLQGLSQEKEMIRVYAGWHHTLVMVVTSSDPHMMTLSYSNYNPPSTTLLFAFGRNDFGQLGLNSNDRIIWNPRRVWSRYDDLAASGGDDEALSIKNDDFERIKSLACGSEHNLAVTQDGLVYSWGWNEHGQLGHNDLKNSHIPKKIQALSDKHIVNVACGSGCSFAIASPR